MKGTPGALIGVLLVPGLAHGQGLSCQVEQDLAGNGSARPQITELVWSEAHGNGAGQGRAATGIGAIAAGDDLKSVTLDGKPVQLPAEAVGLLRFGKAYDYGNRVVLAYRVERENDASATPSEVVYALDERGRVTDVDILPGSEWEAPSHCVLIQ